MNIGLIQYADTNLSIFVTSFAEYKWMKLKEDLVVNVKAKEARAIKFHEKKIKIEMSL